MRVAAAALTLALLAGTLTGKAFPQTHEQERVETFAPMQLFAPSFIPPPTSAAPTTTTTARPTPTTARPTTSSTSEHAARQRASRTTSTTSRARDTTTTVEDGEYVWQPADMPAGCTPNGSKETIAEVARCWDHLVSRWAWPSKSKIFRVMHCESRGRANARNGRYVGLMQEGGGSTNPQQNLARTWSHSRHGTNWGPWACR